MSYRSGTTAHYVRAIYTLSGLETLDTSALKLYFWAIVFCPSGKRDLMTKMAGEEFDKNEDIAFLKSLTKRTQAKISCSWEYWTGRFQMGRVTSEEARTKRDMEKLRHHLRHLPDSTKTQPAS